MPENRLVLPSRRAIRRIAPSPWLTTLMLGCSGTFAVLMPMVRETSPPWKVETTGSTHVSAEAFTGLPLSAVTPDADIEACSGPFNVTSLRIW